MPDFIQRHPSNENINAKTPGRLIVYIILQYAISLRVEKKLPIPLNSFIIN